MRMAARLDKLEASRPSGLSPHIRRWLGQSVTDEEIADYDARLLLEPDFDDEPDVSALSPEARKWLGV